MAYTPYKMKGHVLPGPNQRKSPAKQWGGNFMEQAQARTQEMMSNMRKQQDLTPDADSPSSSMQGEGGGHFGDIMGKLLKVFGGKKDEDTMTQTEGDTVPTPESNAREIDQLTEAVETEFGKSGGNQSGGSNAPEAIAKTQEAAGKIKMPGISSWAKGLFG